MLDTALKFLADEVNVHLQKRTGSNLGKATLCSMADDTGKWTVPKDGIGVSLVNIEEERVLRAQVPERVYVNGHHVALQPELKLNLHVLFSAYFPANYDHALRYISHVLTFFQAHPSFTSDEYPGLGPHIEKLSLEMLGYGPEQLNQMWAYLGARYLPSVVYRIRMVVLQDVEPYGIGTPITAIETALHDK